VRHGSHVDRPGSPRGRGDRRAAGAGPPGDRPL